MIAPTGKVARHPVFSRALAQTLQQAGVVEASPDRVSLTLERLEQTGSTNERVVAVKELLGSPGWTHGTYKRVALSLDMARQWKPSLPGSGQRDSQADCLRLLEALIGPPSATFTTVGSLQSLGYSAAVAQRLLDEQPEVVADLARWNTADPAKAKANDLYRAMALPGGLADYDPDRMGTRNGEMFFSPYEADAQAFGQDRLRDHPDWHGVLLHCQFPSFMIESSPPQGAHISWPILRPSSLPDPSHPDIRPYIAELKSFEFDPQGKGMWSS